MINFFQSLVVAMPSFMLSLISLIYPQVVSISIPSLPQKNNSLSRIFHTLEAIPVGFTTSAEWNIQQVDLFPSIVDIFIQDDCLVIVAPYTTAGNWFGDLAVSFDASNSQSSMNNFTRTSDPITSQHDTEKVFVGAACHDFLVGHNVIHVLLSLFRSGANPIVRYVSVHRAKRHANKKCKWAAATVVNKNHVDLLPAWILYYRHALNICHFYVYLLDEIRHFNISALERWPFKEIISVVEWNIPFWGAEGHIAQMTAQQSIYGRFGSHHSGGILFIDLDEYLILNSTLNLDLLIAAYPKNRWLQFSSVWGLVDSTALENSRNSNVWFLHNPPQVLHIANESLFVRGKQLVQPASHPLSTRVVRIHYSGSIVLRIPRYVGYLLHMVNLNAAHSNDPLRLFSAMNGTTDTTLILRRQN